MMRKEPTQEHKDWCAYIAGLVATHLGLDETKTRAVVGIIERRLWNFPVEEADPENLAVRCTKAPAIVQEMVTKQPDGWYFRFNERGADHFVTDKSVAEKIKRYLEPDETCTEYFKHRSPSVAVNIEFMNDLERSKTKHPGIRKMFDGLLGEIHELKRAYQGDGDVRAEAFDVAVCAYRIATEGDEGGNEKLEHVPDWMAWGSEPAVAQGAPVPPPADVVRKLVGATEELKYAIHMGICSINALQRVDAALAKAKEHGL